MTIWMILAVLALSMGTALVTTPYIRQLALTVGMLDESGERRMHDTPKPRIGGIAVYLGFAFALFAALGYLFNTHQLNEIGNVHDVVSPAGGLEGLRPQTASMALTKTMALWPNSCP